MAGGAISTNASSSTGVMSRARPEGGQGHEANVEGVVLLHRLHHVGGVAGAHRKSPGSETAGAVRAGSAAAGRCRRWRRCQAAPVPSAPVARRAMASRGRDRGLDPIGIVQQLNAGHGRLRLPPDALDQPDAEPLLQCAHLQADGRCATDWPVRPRRRTRPSSITSRKAAQLVEIEAGRMRRQGMGLLTK